MEWDGITSWPLQPLHQLPLSRVQFQTANWWEKVPHLSLVGSSRVSHGSKQGGGRAWAMVLETRRQKLWVEDGVPCGGPQTEWCRPDQSPAAEEREGGGCVEGEEVCLGRDLQKKRGAEHQNLKAV